MAKRDDLRIGFVGTGVHATANIHATLRLLKIPVQAVCSLKLEEARATAGTYGTARAYDDYKAMLQAENLDVVFVITDSYSQSVITSECLNAGTHVFVEKALGMSEAEAAKVADLSAKSGKHVMVGFMKRFAPSYALLQQAMRNGAEFGKVLSFTGMFAITSGRPGWDDNVFIKVGGVHYVDLMRHLFGEPLHIDGFTNSVDVQVDEIFSVRFDSGVIGSMFFGGVPAWARHWEELTVTGVKGFAKVDNMQSVRVHSDSQEKARGPRWQTIDEEDKVYSSMNTSSSGGWKDLYLNGYVGEVEHFLKCVVSNTAPITSAFDNVKTMAFCDRILASLKK